MELGFELWSDSTVPHGGWKLRCPTSQTKTAVMCAPESPQCPGPWQELPKYMLGRWMDRWGKKGGYFKIIQYCFLPNLTLDWSLTVLSFPGQIAIVLWPTDFPRVLRKPCGIVHKQAEGFLAGLGAVPPRKQARKDHSLFYLNPATSPGSHCSLSWPAITFQDFLGPQALSWTRSLSPT